MDKQVIIESARETPILMEVDVAVAGAGSAGVMAALAAARAGASVVLIERYGALGGNMTVGFNTKPSGALLGGIPKEVWDRAREIGAAGKDYMATTTSGEEVKLSSPCDPELM